MGEHPACVAAAFQQPPAFRWFLLLKIYMHNMNGGYFNVRECTLDKWCIMYPHVYMHALLMVISLQIVMEYCGAGSVSDIMRMRQKTVSLHCEIVAALTRMFNCTHFSLQYCVDVVTNDCD